MNKITKFFLATLQVQLFLNIISLIIISHWGLPLSCATLVSNIIFSPFLMAFLLLSSLIFFTELFYIPNLWLIYLLELVTHSWSKIMSFGDKSWTMNVSKPSTVFSTIAILICVAILQSKHLRTPAKRIVAFTLLLTGILFYLKHTQLPKHDVQTIPLGKKSISIIYTQKTISIIDNGALGQLACTRGWLEFTLLPLLRKTYATDTISHLILPRPTVKTLQTLNDLCDISTVKHAYLPYWQGTTPRNLARAYVIARNNLLKNGTMHRIGNKNIHIPLNTSSWIKLIAKKHQATYRTIHFPQIEVTCILADKNISDEITPKKTKREKPWENFQEKKLS